LVAERHIGTLGTAVRVVVGLAFTIYGAFGHASTTAKGLLVEVDFVPRFELNVAALAVGLLLLPAITLAFQWLRSRRFPSRLDETGPGAALLNIVVTLGIVIVTVFIFPAISFIGFGAVLFYGVSMLLAAIRGYAGCEVLAVSNWVLRRDDQIGCMLLSPIDHLEESRG
jgi:hypothetical protein